MRRFAVGEERTSPNGYVYTKTTTGWELKQRVEAAKKLGRPLKEGERVFFMDGNRSNFDPDNLIVSVGRQRRTTEARIAKIDAKIADLKAQRQELVKSQREERGSRNLY